MDAVVVGAGISGLVTAHALRKRSRSCEIVDLGSRPGGVIGTRRRDGFLYETGPNSVLDTTPLIGALLQDLGIAQQTQRPSRRHAMSLATDDSWRCRPRRVRC